MIAPWSQCIEDVLFLLSELATDQIILNPELVVFNFILFTVSTFFIQERFKSCLGHLFFNVLFICFFVHLFYFLFINFLLYRFLIHLRMFKPVSFGCLFLLFFIHFSYCFVFYMFVICYNLLNEWHFCI